MFLMLDGGGALGGRGVSEEGGWGVMPATNIENHTKKISSLFLHETNRK